MASSELTFYKMLPEMGPPETTIWEFPMPTISWTVEFADFIDDDPSPAHSSCRAEGRDRGIEHH